jgi:bifunctional ADP-heptose synthase (sugar kinase/adenylyltransferase)
MKLLLIGHSVEDHVHIGEKEIIGPGGIFYAAMGLIAFVSPNDELFLISSMEKKCENLFSFLYDKINSKYIRFVENMPKVHLRIAQTSQRCENHENITQILDVTNIDNLNEFNGILINMITGFDITLQDMLNIRKNYNGLIYLDIHSLARGLDKDQRRPLRLIPDAKQWISAADIIQVNENELYTLSEKKNEFEAAKEILETGLKYIIITKGEFGASILYCEKEELKSVFISSLKNNSSNKIGCGDIFGSTFFYFYLLNSEILQALKVANVSAGCSIGYTNIDEFKKLKDDTFSELNKK